jgi:hypothetical protein
MLTLMWYCGATKSVKIGGLHGQLCLDFFLSIPRTRTDIFERRSSSHTLSSEYALENRAPNILEFIIYTYF